MTTDTRDWNDLLRPLSDEEYSRVPKLSAQDVEDALEAGWREWMAECDSRSWSSRPGLRYR